MLKLGKTILNGTPRVAVGFKDNLSADILQQIEDYGLDVVELRIDLYSSFDTQHVIQEVKKLGKFSSIATIRLEKEGGEWNLSEQKRVALFKAIIPYVDAVDIELYSQSILKEVISAAHKAKKLVCVSYHNFDKTPSHSKLTEILKEAKANKADIVKIATLALTRTDVQNLANFTIANKDKNIITIAMGAEGVISRILFPALGSLLTYASLGSSTAPGQLDYSITFDFLRRLYPKYNQEKINSLKLLELA